MKYIHLLPVLPIFLMVGCQTYEDRLPSTEPKQSSTSQLSELQSLRCSLGTLTEDATLPSGLYKEMVTCAQQGKFEKAATFYGIAGTFSSYDALSINTRYARERHASLLREGFAPLTASEREKTWAAIRDTMESTRKKEVLCHRVSNLGPPQYYPEYMLKNSLSFQGGSIDVRTSRWYMALRSYLDC